MPFQLSPGVAVVEKDFSAIVPAVSTSRGATVGAFVWGPVMAPVQVTSENELVQIFGKPQDANAQAFFTAANFLSYTNALLVTRADCTNARNAVVSQSGSVSAISKTASGTNYTSAPTIAISAPQVAGGIQATATATLSGGSVTAITITSGGSGYTGTPTVTISAPQVAGGVTATATLTVTSGVITAITITSGGSGYTSAPTAFITGTGTGAAVGTITISGSAINTITITNPGSGYTSAPTVSFTGGGGSGALATATVTPSGVKINNNNVYLNSFINGEGTYGEFAAKYPGTLGNSLQVSMADSATFAGWTYASAFPSAPGTSPYAASVGGSNDELHIVVIDQDGLWTGIPGTVLEKFAYVSKASDAKKPDGSSNYYKNVVNGDSKYVWWMDHIPVGVLAGAFNTSSAVAKGAVLKSSSNFYVVTTAGTTGSSAPTGTVAGVNETNGTAVLQYLADTNWGSAASVNSVGVTFGSQSVVYTASLSGGADDLAVTDGQLQNAWALYADDAQYDISLLPVGPASATVAQYVISNVAESRLDCVAFISPQDVTTGNPITGSGNTATAALVAYRNLISSTSYGVMDSGYKYQYDRYNDKYRFVPLNGDTAGLCARTDSTNDPWYSPGGLNRGQIKNVVKLAINPTKADRDVLYSAGINPVVTFPGQGTVLYGDKTLLSRPSAFDRINVRRLFIVLEKAIATAAKFQLFEFNDSFTQAQFRNLVEPFLRGVQGRRGVTDFKVVCDGTNNTGEVIDANQFVADIYVKPNRSINYITLNFVAARSSISFTELGA